MADFCTTNFQGELKWKGQAPIMKQLNNDNLKKTFSVNIHKQKFNTYVCMYIRVNFF